MIDTRLLGSGAATALAAMLAFAAPPALAAAAMAPDALGIVGADNITTDIAALQERGRGGREGRSGGGGMRARDTGSWNGAEGRARSGGGRSWGGGQAASGDAATTRVRRSGGYERSGGGNQRGARSYERGSRNYAGNPGGYTRNSSTYNVSSSTSGYSGRERGAGAGERSAYTGGSGYAGGVPAAGTYTGNARGRGAEARGGQGRRAALTDPGSINAGDIQAPPSYGEGNRSGAATPYITDNLAAQGVPVASTEANNAGRADLSERRGGGRGEWNGNRGGGQPTIVQRGGGRAENRGNWNDNRRGDNRGEWRGDNRGNWNDNRRGDWRGNDRGNWRGDNRGNWVDNRRGDRRGDWRGNRGGGQFAYNQGFRDGARWDRGWRDNRRFNWTGHRQANRFLFSPGRYFAPFAGHFYRPVGIGFFLDPLFFQPRFFLNDPWAFRLPPPGQRFRWVRYYEDVLLVDVFTGEVVDVIQNFFW